MTAPADLHRIGVKLPLDAADPDLAVLIPLFHGFIRDRRLPGLLIDVADYRHLPGGPGVMLVGHEGLWSLDMADGRPGIQYTRRQPWPAGDLAARIAACRDLCEAAAAGLPWPLLPGRAWVFANDRLRAPSSEEVRLGLADAARTAFPGAEVRALAGDPRDRPTVEVLPPA